MMMEEATHEAGEMLSVEATQVAVGIKHRGISRGKRAVEAKGRFESPLPCHQPSLPTHHRPPHNACITRDDACPGASTARLPRPRLASTLVEAAPPHPHLTPPATETTTPADRRDAGRSAVVWIATMNAQHDLRPGQRIGGRYAVERPIGRWQIGTAYAVREGRTETPRTLLVMDLHRGALSQYLRWVRTEAEQARLLPEGFWVPIEGGHVFGDRAFMVLPPLSGTSLAQMVATEGSLDEERAVRIIERLCRLVGKAHAEGIGLGCLRPGNVFVDLKSAGGPQPTVFDVGLARGLDRLLARPPRPQSRYTPPDARADMPVAADDIYALGALLYFLLTAQKPPTTDLEGHRLMTPPSWRRRDSALTAFVDPIVLEAMAPLARDRYDFAEALADALVAVVEVFRLSPDARAVLGIPTGLGAERPARQTHPHYLHDLLGLPAEPTADIPIFDDPLDGDD